MKTRYLTMIAIAAMMTMAGESQMMAQTKKETKQYAKTISKATVAAYEKFLSVFPESVYAGEIELLRDRKLYEAVDKDDVLALEDFLAKYPKTGIKDEVEALVDRLNTSDITADEALAIANEALENKAEKAVALRYRNMDIVLALPKNASCVYKLIKSGETWNLAETIPVDRGTHDSSLNLMEIGETMDMVRIGTDRGLNFDYWCSSEASDKVEYVTSFINISDSEQYSSQFYGRKIGGKIEGSSPDDLSIQTGMSIHTSWLYARLNENPSLVRISEENLKADQAIEWWLRNNPNALTNSKRLSPGKLDENNAIVAQYKKSAKEKGSGYDAAKFNFRGYLMICAYNRSTGEYVLVWCEPQNTKGRAGRDLRSIYFETGSSVLDLFYYQGNKTFKIKLNLSSKTISRS